MKTYRAKTIENFIGRKAELKIIDNFIERDQASILVVHGRRRVGKTALIEHVFSKRNLLKFEGIQGKDQDFQKKEFLRALAQYVGDTDIQNLSYTTWIQVFEKLASYVTRGKWTIYLEELQWLADYKEDLIAELKYVWDNKFRKNPQLRLVLCGSSVSYFRTKVLRSQALYNRSITELPVEQFSITEAKEFYKPSNTRDLFDAYLTVGGIPEYLREIRGKDSLYQKIKNKAGTPGGFFVDEFERIFVSSLASNLDCRAILMTVGKKKITSRDEILLALTKKSGSGVSTLIEELVQSELLEACTPLNLTGKNKIIRYKIRDYFLNFYFSFIFTKKIRSLTYASYRSWLGYAFERFCRYNSEKIASCLGFHGIEYDSGSIYNRVSITKGVQIDLAFRRKDKVITICEIKYGDAPIGTKIIEEFENKIQALNLDASKQQLQRVLITASGISKELRSRSYFDRIIELEELI